MERLKACHLLKKAASQVLSCEFYKIFKNTYFVEYLRTAASVSHLYTSAHAKYSKFNV